MFDLENSGKVHGVNHSMTNTNLPKSHIWQFFVNSHHFADIQIKKKIYNLENLGQGHWVQPFDGKYQPL